MSAPRGGRAGGRARAGTSRRPPRPSAPGRAPGPAQLSRRTGEAPLLEPRAVGEGRAQLRVDVGKAPREAHTHSGVPKELRCQLHPRRPLCRPSLAALLFPGPQITAESHQGEAGPWAPASGSCGPQSSDGGRAQANGQIRVPPPPRPPGPGMSLSSLAESGLPAPTHHAPWARAPGWSPWRTQRGSCAPAGQSSPLTPIPQRVPRGWVGVPGCQFMGLGEGTQLDSREWGPCTAA